MSWLCSSPRNSLCIPHRTGWPNGQKKSAQGAQSQVCETLQILPNPPTHGPESPFFAQSLLCSSTIGAPKKTPHHITDRVHSLTDPMISKTHPNCTIPWANMSQESHLSSVPGRCPHAPTPSPLLGQHHGSFCHSVQPPSCSCNHSVLFAHL